MELINIAYATANGLVKATQDDVDKHFAAIKTKAANAEWELTQKRNDRSVQYMMELQDKDEMSRQETKNSTSRKWILPNEYAAFLNGISHAMELESNLEANGEDPGPFCQLLQYKPNRPAAGMFPPNKIWWRDMMRVLLGLSGSAGDDMRSAELSVYHGTPFQPMTGRKKVQNNDKMEHFEAVGQYWRAKISEEMKQTVKRNMEQIQFLFTKPDVNYYNKMI